MPRRRKRHRSVEEVRVLLARARERGLSRCALADELGVHPNTVSNWVRRERDGGPSCTPRSGSERSPCAVSLVPVRVVEPVGGQSSRDGVSGLELVVERVVGDRDVTLRLNHGFDPDDLRAVLAAIAQHAC